MKSRTVIFILLVVLFIQFVPVGIAAASTFNMAFVTTSQDTLPPDPIENPPELPTEWLAVLGAVAPVIIQLLDRYIKTKTGRTVVAMILTFGIAVGGSFATGYGDFSSPERVVFFIFATFGIATFLFKTFFNPLVFKPEKRFKFLTDGSGVKNQTEVEK